MEILKPIEIANDSDYYSSVQISLTGNQHTICVHIKDETKDDVTELATFFTVPQAIKLAETILSMAHQIMTEDAQ